MSDSITTQQNGVLPPVHGGTGGGAYNKGKAGTIDSPPSNSPRQNLGFLGGEDQAAAKRKRTVGNIIYDWGIYTSFAWAGVAALSLLSAHEAMHGNNRYFNWLRSLNNNVQGGLTKLLSSTIMKNATKETVEGWAKGSTMFVTLGLGGTAMMLPIKWMEDNRQKNACIIDNMLGTTPPDPELVAKEVPQTWKSVLSGRMFAWATSYAAFVLMGPKLTGEISQGFGKAFTSSWMKLAPKADPATVRRWADIGAFDATFTVITAALTYLFSRYVAKKSHKNLDSDAALMTIDPATPTPFEPVYNDPAPAKIKGRFADKHPPRPRQIHVAASELYSEKIARSEVQTPGLASPA